MKKLSYNILWKTPNSLKLCFRRLSMTAISMRFARYKNESMKLSLDNTGELCLVMPRKLHRKARTLRLSSPS